MSKAPADCFTQQTRTIRRHRPGSLARLSTVLAEWTLCQLRRERKPAASWPYEQVKAARTRGYRGCFFFVSPTTGRGSTRARQYAGIEMSDARSPIKATVHRFEDIWTAV